MIAQKFVTYDVPPLESLKDSFAYQTKEKILMGNKLSRLEKNRLYAELRGNSYFQTAIPLQGWKFDFRDILKKYIVKYKHGGIEERYAPDKVAIRHYAAIGIEYIIEVK